MNCKEIRDIIITDYIDSEMDAKTRGEMELHLSICAGCSEFREKLVSSAVAPLRNARKETPPEYLWFRVRGAFQKAAREESSFDLGGLISSLIPRWANVAVLASIIAFTTVAGNLLAHNIFENRLSGAQLVSEAKDNLALGELSDMPSDQVAGVYSNIIGG